MDISIIKRTYDRLVLLSNQWFQLFGNMLINPTDANNIKGELNCIAQIINDRYPSISTELYRLQNCLYDVRGVINPVVMGELIALLRYVLNSAGNSEFWNMIHPEIIRVSKKLYDDGHYANASEDAFIEINFRVKKIFKIVNPNSDNVPDGDKAMTNVFSVNNPILKLADISTETGKNIQKGYMHMFSGAISALRNPKAHNNISLSEDECKRNLVFASMLMYKIDDGVRYTGIKEY